MNALLGPPLDPLLASLLALGCLALVAGLLLGFAAEKFKVQGEPLVEHIDALLPQTQCGQCGHPGCRPYAQAIAAGEAINRCPPGGQATIDALAALLGQPSQPLDSAHGSAQTQKTLAYIREDECIGCTKCIAACPVDAIVGAAKFVHTVITQECTGCDLCVEPCPVDCIDMLPVQPGLQAWAWPEPSSPPTSLLIASDKS
jgi:Na+-translocating ferredoxin:NAD+ oxidoreductase subunit B